MQMIWVFIGGFLGTIIRYSVEFSGATFFVNMMGSFFIGLIYALLGTSKRQEHLKFFLIIGILGSLTTVSHWISEIGLDLRWHHYLSLLFQIIIVPIVGILLCSFGYERGRKLKKM